MAQKTNRIAMTARGALAVALGAAAVFGGLELRDGLSGPPVCQCIQHEEGDVWCAVVHDMDTDATRPEYDPADAELVDRCTMVSKKPGRVLYVGPGCPCESLRPDIHIWIET